MIRKLPYILMLVFVSLTPRFVNSADRKSESMALLYDKPATEWVEALPIGNGRIGAMVFGRTANERIQFNEDSFWAGGPYDPVNPQALAALPEARRLVFEGKAEQAQKLINEKMMGVPSAQASYQPVGDLNLVFNGHEQASDYRRELDLSTAVVTVKYKVGGVAYERRIFSTPVDQVIVIQLTADKPGMINFTAFFSSPQKNQKVEAARDSLILEVAGKESYGTAGALRCRSMVKIIPEKGKIRLEDNKLCVEGADLAVLLLASATNYINYKDTGGNPEAVVEKQIKSASKKPFEKILSDHIKGASGAFQSCSA